MQVPAPFEYERATSVRHAVDLLERLGSQARVIAGGHSLLPMMKLRLAQPEYLIDINDLGGELAGITIGPDEVRIGALTRHRELLESDALAEVCPIFRDAERVIADPLVRNRGTLGGSLCQADPAAEYPAVALALDADFEVLTTSGTRVVPANEFFTGVWSTAVADDELLAAVRFPIWTGRCGFAVREFARRHGDFAIAGAALAVELGGDDRVARVGIGLFGLGSTPERGAPAEAAALGQPAGELDADELGRLAVGELDSIPTDLHGSAEYRRRVGAAMVAAAWRDAIEEARR